MQETVIFALKIAGLISTPLAVCLVSYSLLKKREKGGNGRPLLSLALKITIPLSGISLGYGSTFGLESRAPLPNVIGKILAQAGELPEVEDLSGRWTAEYMGRDGNLHKEAIILEQSGAVVHGWILPLKPEDPDWEFLGFYRDGILVATYLSEGKEENRARHFQGVFVLKKGPDAEGPAKERLRLLAGWYGGAEGGVAAADLRPVEYKFKEQPK